MTVIDLDAARRAREPIERLARSFAGELVDLAEETARAMAEEAWFASAPHIRRDRKSFRRINRQGLTKLLGGIAHATAQNYQPELRQIILDFARPIYLDHLRRLAGARDVSFGPETPDDALIGPDP